MNILNECTSIMQKETELKTGKNISSIMVQLPQIYNVVERIIEITKNSTILRSGNNTGKLTNDSIAFESDGAHTNLVRSLVKYALDIYYGWGKSTPEYYRSEIDEAITIHDLPENITGDIPDNRNRNEIEKNRIEDEYFDKLMNTYSSLEFLHYRKIKKLLQEMRKKTSFEGRILYVADKLSAILMMLYYDSIGLYPSIAPEDPRLSKITQEEKGFCEIHRDGTILLSELWTIDFLYGRNIVQYDDTGFFLAVLVLATLQMRGEWYDWRKAQYIQ